MPCSDFQKLISAKLDKELTSEEGQILSRHLETCPACREFEKALRELKVAIQTWENVEIPVELENRILRQTVKAVRKDRPFFNFLHGCYQVPRGLAWASVLLVLILLINSFFNPLKSITLVKRTTEIMQPAPQVHKVIVTEKDMVRTYTISEAKGKS